jgi:hypothetical protein
VIHLCWLIDMGSSSSCKPCDSVTMRVIVSKGRSADDGSHAIGGCDETTISNGRRGRPRGRGADQHRRIGNAARAGWRLGTSADTSNFHPDTHSDSNAHSGTYTSDRHHPGAGLPAEHGARL